MKSLFARLLGRTITPIRTSVTARNANRCRPTLEQLGDRVVPATHTWLGTVSDQATNLANWSIVGGTSLPGVLDNLAFNGSAVRNCVGLVSTGNSFASVSLESSFTRLVSLGEDLTFGNFYLRGGSISQPNTDIDLSVSGTFEWTAGTLNSAANGAIFHLLPGATATINPGTGNIVNCGSTFSLDPVTSLDPVPLPGATATFTSGELHFTAGLGIVIENLGLFKVIAPENATIKVTGEGTFFEDKLVLVKTGGTCDIQSASATVPGTFDQAKGLRNDGGLVTFSKKVTAKFGGLFPVVGSSVHQTAGKMVLENGSTLDVTNGLTLYGGKFSTQAIDLGVQPVAKIKGNMSNVLTETNTGADI